MPQDETGAARALIDQELRDFRLAGVALPKEQKDRFKELMSELAEVQARFQQNVQDSADAWHFHSDNETTFAGLPGQIMERAAQDAAANNVSGFWLNLDFPTYHAVIMQADDRNLRKEFYTAWNTRASDVGAHRKWDNSDNIRKVLALRQEAAQLVGFGNYAEYSLATKMAADTDEVIEFLCELASRTRATAESELAAIRDFAPHDLEAWDVAYYQEKLKQQKYAISDDELRQYFPAATVKKGLFELAHKLYNVSLAVDPDVQCWDDSVSYYQVADENGNVIGGFYTDLYARPGKRNGAWIDECIVRKNLSGENVLPVGYLVCNFSPPDKDGVSLLTHNDVLTLFHEFGHMLHHLLTRIDFPSIAGINGVPWDAVELPSQFMENFAWCYEVLERASSHHASGDALPADIFARLDRSRHFGAGLAMLRQIEFALFDFRLHREFDPAAPAEVLQVLNRVREEVAVVTHPEFNRMPHAFSHIFSGGYAAGYYSYKWAEVLAADAFSAFADAGIFDQPTATRFREEILEIGGSKDIMEAFVSFRGRKPRLDALLRYSGISESA